MTSPDSNEKGSLGTQLEGLTVLISEFIDKARATREVEPEQEVQFRWKVDQFQYTDNGIVAPIAHADYPTKQTWFRASGKILAQIEQTASYSNLVERLRQEYGADRDCAEDLESFALRVIDTYLNPTRIGDRSIDSFIINFLADLNEEPVMHGAEVELNGITLRSKTIEPAFGIELRQPRIEDLEKETPAYMPSIHDSFLPNPSAYLRIEFLGRGCCHYDRSSLRA